MTTNNKRHHSLEGGYNFRDLGGYSTKNGKTVQWKKIFRSDDLSNLSNADLDYLSDLSIATVVDFRSKEEALKAPNKIPASVKNVFPFSINPGNMDITQITELFEKMPIEQIMEKIYHFLVQDEEIISQYRKFFALLQNSDNIPLVFHCSAGKDRTGMAAALFLNALGVDEKIIMDDYLLSNQYIKNKYAPIVAQKPHYKPFFEVESRYLKLSFDTIKDNYSTIDNYLEKVLNVDIFKLREKYLD